MPVLERLCVPLPRGLSANAERETDIGPRHARSACGEHRRMHVGESAIPLQYRPPEAVERGSRERDFAVITKGRRPSDRDLLDPKHLTIGPGAEAEGVRTHIESTRPSFDPLELPTLLPPHT
jgi:hypothetical protein